MLTEPVRKTRLNNDDFIALRSLGKEERVVGSSIAWKHNGIWGELDSKGYWWAPEGSSGSWHGNLLDRAHAAFNRLEVSGLAQTRLRRCCPGTTCHLNDKVILELTDRGKALLEKANSHSAIQPFAQLPQALAQVTRQSPPIQRKPIVPDWLRRLFAG